ncbi:HB2L protein, partial [Malurus elegans]|nr:HB2L protein [Malurus elegans]
APRPVSAHSAVFQFLAKSECHFTNGTKRVRLVGRYIYNREQFMHFDSDVGLFVGDTHCGEKQVEDLNSQADFINQMRAAGDRCRHN